MIEHVYITSLFRDAERVKATPVYKQKTLTAVSAEKAEGGIEKVTADAAMRCFVQCLTDDRL